jgi:antitoxin (DNA-binding transcriptional repressor) of toxin-antitoxin stability system
MITVTAVELRNDLENIINTAASGQEVFISFRQKTRTKIVTTDKTKGNTKSLLNFLKKNKFKFNAKNGKNIANNTPAQDKAMIHEFWDKKYLNK